MNVQPQSATTPEQYLANEREAEFRSEYFGGEVFALAGASRRHIRVVTNLLFRLESQLLTGPCNVYANDMKVRIPNSGLYLLGEKENKVDAPDYTYPDIVVSCGDEEFLDEEGDVLLNPVLIIEVLSKSTESYDRGRKFEHYQSIESLKEYLLVAQLPQRIERYTRRSVNEWLYTDFRSPDDIIRLESIDCELLMSDVYHKV
jgi:Uma2 family endonuclease